MSDKTPWYLYPQDEPERQPAGDDPVALLVGLLLMSILGLVALDHALYQIWSCAVDWWQAITS